jgi:hypothetical protein
VAAEDKIAAIAKAAATAIKESSSADAAATAAEARDLFISDEATEALRDRRSVNYCVIYVIGEAAG